MSTLAPANGTPQESNEKLPIVNPAGLYDQAANGYSHAIVAEGDARIAYLAGQGGEDHNGALSLKFADQVQPLAFRNNWRNYQSST